jgi:hypothetical protein
VIAAYVLSTSVFAADSYLCIADLSTGFRFDSDTKRWVSTSFKPIQKFIVSRRKADSPWGKEYKWLVTQVGDTAPASLCNLDFDQSGNLICFGFTEFRMNNKNLRFLSIYVMGYWMDNVDTPWGLTRKEGDDAPAMSIGKCSPI